MNASLHARRSAHFPIQPRSLAAAPAADTRSSSPGNWRYGATPRHRWTYGAGILLSVGIHTAIFFGLQSEPEPVRAPAKVEEQVIAMEMPPLAPDEPEPQPTELVEAPAETVAVPQLAEVPTMVALSDFQQRIDFRPRAEIDPNALRQLTIPVNHGRALAGGANAANLFKLSDLDRVPQPVAQPAPNYPEGAKRSASEEEVVRLSFIVDAEGRVREPRVLSSTNRDFERAAVEGVLRWKFKPGIKGGRKVASMMEIPLKFVVTDAI